MRAVKSFSLPRVKVDITTNDAPELRPIVLLKDGYKLGTNTYHITGAGEALVFGYNNYLIREPV